MGKISSKYLQVDPNRIIELGFHKEKNMVSESLFSLGNEYSGVRGFFEEGVSLPSLIGTYYNGIIEYSLDDTPNAYKGIAKRGHFTINSTNYLKCSIVIDGEKLDLATNEIKDFKRILDMRNGLLNRSFILITKKGEVEISFQRLLGMESHYQAIQTISFKSNYDAQLDIAFYLDGNILHWGNHCYWERGYEKPADCGATLFIKTPRTKQSLLTSMKVISPFKGTYSEQEKEVSLSYSGTLKKNQSYEFIRYVVNIADKNSDQKAIQLEKEAHIELKQLEEKGIKGLLKENSDFFQEAYAMSDIQIEGNEEDAQGIRFCLFNMQQAYHGFAEDNNIGAKGLTGEAYSGHAFWDSETYCLPYYLFSNQKAAKDLILFRYHTLEDAKKRAKDLDCEGACYPIATRNGEEACTLWQHASTQLQPTSAVGYAIFHYMNIYHDEEFMDRYGLEMLLEISKFLYTRGQWNNDHTAFGYYGVMGPDEFEVMVNHNTYTNFMNKKIMAYTLEVLFSYKDKKKDLITSLGYNDKFIADMKSAVTHMRILYDDKTKLFEQHMGYYDLPHIDVDEIPQEDFPLYSHWSYDRIYRNDMIKQPDVLMFMFLYHHDFTYEQIKANYEFYEPRCIHESSLSPSIHSIFAAELGKYDEALNFFGFATRLDLDDYNRNTKEGLHMTSIAAAWMNIVYGFLGLRSDDKVLSINPYLPKRWKSYQVNIRYRESNIIFKVEKEHTSIRVIGEPIDMMIKGELYHINEEIII